jgi:hypothetical protein
MTKKLFKNKRIYILFLTNNYNQFTTQVDQKFQPTFPNLYTEKVLIY